MIISDALIFPMSSISKIVFNETGMFNLDEKVVLKRSVEFSRKRNGSTSVFSDIFLAKRCCNVVAKASSVVNTPLRPQSVQVILESFSVNSLDNLPNASLDDEIFQMGREDINIAPISIEKSVMEIIHGRPKKLLCIKAAEYDRVKFSVVLRHIKSKAIFDILSSAFSLGVCIYECGAIPREMSYSKSSKRSRFISLPCAKQDNSKVVILDRNKCSDKVEEKSMTVKKILGRGSFGYAILLHTINENEKIVIKVDRSRTSVVWEYFIHAQV